MAILILREVVLHFPALYTPTPYQAGGALMYRAKFAIPPDSENYKNVVAIRDQLFAEKFKNRSDMILKEIEYNAQKNAFVNGDKYTTTNGFPGNYILSSVRAQKDGRPALVDRDGKRHVEESEAKFYSGAIVNAKVDLWAQDGANSGFRCTLITVQYVRNGPSFGGAAPATADGMDDLGFDESDDDLL